MSDKVKKIVVRVLAVVLTALMILSVCAQFVFAAEEKESPDDYCYNFSERINARFPAYGSFSISLKCLDI